jgi:hypothetical protein
VSAIFEQIRIGQRGEGVSYDFFVDQRSNFLFCACISTCFLIRSFRNDINQTPMMTPTVF